ncbi:molybdate ABC transporter permease subunit [Hydrogenophaga sp.]|uniref:molybdate ABC transporter permease subunit n=1 Tax=Hydrogenophaga sp. TaxID=1904254 RepID=UPI00356831C7
MDWTALALSLQLAAATVALLLPLGLWLGRWLARTPSRWKIWIEAAVLLPLVLPPTVLGYYLLVGMGGASPVGQWFQQVLGVQLTFSFTGLLLASIVFNLPFALQPLQRAYENVPRSLHEAALVCGLGAWERFWRVDLPLVWPGVLSALVMTFAHTLGEFGVVLMVGGSIPGETKTLSIAIYDQVQAFDLRSAHLMSLSLLAISLLAIGASLLASRKMAAPAHP